MSSQAVAWAITHRAGGLSSKAVLLTIANYANEFGECWASQATIADGSECSVRQLRRVLADLQRRGLMRRERRGGEGNGRQSDRIRLCMVELPVIVSAQRRDKTQADNLAASQGATGQKCRHPHAGNRTKTAGQPDIAMSEDPKNPRILSRDRIYDDVERFVAAVRPVLTTVGNNRTKPKQCRVVLPPLLAKHGYDALLEATKEFYRSPGCTAEGGKFQPGLQVIAGDGRLDAFIERSSWAAGADQPDWPRRIAYWRNNDHWPERWGPPPGKPGYLGPPIDDLLKPKVQHDRKDGVK